MEIIGLIIFLIVVGVILKYYGDEIHPQILKLLILVIVLAVLFVVCGWFGFGPGLSIVRRQ